MLKKICDLVFTIPAGSDIWPLTHFEPLIVGICLPLSRHLPWKLKGTPMLVQMEGVLRGLSTLDHRWGQTILRQLLQQARELESLHPSLVRSFLHTAG